MFSPSLPHCRSVCLPFAIYFLATTRFNSKTSKTCSPICRLIAEEKTSSISWVLYVAPFPSHPSLSCLPLPIVLCGWRRQRCCTQHNYHNFAYSASSGSLRPRTALSQLAPSILHTHGPLSQCTSHSFEPAQQQPQQQQQLPSSSAIRSKISIDFLT